MSVFGVDFGCLNCCIALTRKGGVDIILNEVSKRETSSIVGFGSEERYLGEAALDTYVRNMKNTIPCIQHWIGMKRGHRSFENEKRFIFCNTETDQNNRVLFNVEFNGAPTKLYPEQVMGMLLKKFQCYVNKELSTDLKRPIELCDFAIAVPSWFCAEQRMCVLQACEVANLNCLGLINDNAAVALDYGIFRGSSLPEKEEDGNYVAMVDIGYGHTTLSLCRFWRSNVRIVSRVTDTSCCVREVDYMLYKHFSKKIKEKYSIDISENKKAQLRVLQSVDKVKKMLSANRTAPFFVENVMDLDVDIPNFSREEFEEIIQPLVERYKTLIRQIFEESKVTPEQLHSFEMIGGGCRIPILKRATEEACEKKICPSFTVNATESVARGAAIFAAMHSPKVQVREFYIHEKPLLPYLIGLENSETANTPCNISFLPNINEVIPLLKSEGSYPINLIVKTKRVSPFSEFKVNVFYNNTADKSNLVEEGSYILGEWTIGQNNRTNCDKLVKLLFKIDTAGLVTCDSASVTEVTEVEVEEEKKNSENPDDKPEIVKVKKQKKQNIKLSCTPSFILGHSAEMLSSFISTERAMGDHDKEILTKKEAKNLLEGYIVHHRIDIVDGRLKDYIADDKKKEFQTRANDDEEWLYDEGVDAPLQEYNKRLQSLKDIVEPVIARHRMFDSIEFEFSQFSLASKNFSNQLMNKQKTKPEHITEEEFKVAEDSIKNAEEIVKKAVQQLLNSSKKQDPPISLHQIMVENLNKVQAEVHKVVNKPKPEPTPKKETTDSTEEETKMQKAEEMEAAKPEDEVETAM